MNILALGFLFPGKEAFRVLDSFFAVYADSFFRIIPHTFQDYFPLRAVITEYSAAGPAMVLSSERVKGLFTVLA